MSCYLFRLFIDCVLHHVLQKHVAMDFSLNPSNGFHAFPPPSAYGICFAAGDLSCISWSVVTVGSKNKIIIRVYRKRKKEKTHSKHAAWLLLGRSAAIFSFTFPLLSSVWCVALFSLMLYQQYESFRRTLPEKRVDKKKKKRLQTRAAKATAKRNITKPSKVKKKNARTNKCASSGAGR